ncbi:hypothetical protein GOBAR_DD16635 [Gossypium barbadense]|nr:hypothetical protein GOBAR_DD16635 [Gossypium barbadense]
MMKIKTPKKGRVKRELDKRAPKLVETGKKTLILQGTKTSGTLNSVLSEIYHLKKGGAVRFTRKNDNIRPFESGGETSLEFFSLKTDCSIFVYGSHSKKRPNNLVIGRMYDHHVYDLVEVGIYIPDQKVGEMALPNKAKGVKRERREAKNKDANEHKEESE